MRHFRSLLIDQADIRMPGLHILTFAVHRHLPKHTSIEPHQHRWCQLLLYLGGQGRQIFKHSNTPVEPGTLVVLPPGISHAFQRATARMPLCLTIDFRLTSARSHQAVVCSMNRSEISQVRQHLAHLLKLQADTSGVLRWESAVVILQLLVTLLRTAGWLERLPPSSGGGNGSAMHRLLSTMDPATPLLKIVERSGYQRDHLNRLLKKETGLTLGQFRARRRLAKAKELLSQGMQVADVADAVGLLDQSYFARWFRRQTGQPPSQWNRHY
jgi:AraC family transcriptional regulator, transcriptional activator of pobA